MCLNETYSKIRIGKTIQNGLKEGGALFIAIAFQLYYRI
jgi:hypothetical protein